MIRTTKYGSATLLLLLLGVWAIAQQAPLAISQQLPRFQVGAAAGANLNFFTAEQPQTGFSAGINAGASVQYRLPHRFTAQVEVNYLQQGGQILRWKDDTRFGMPDLFTFKNVKNSYYTLHSLELPVLLKKSFFLSRLGWTPSVYAGGSVAFTLSATERYRKTGNMLEGEYIPATVTGYQDAQLQFEEYRYNGIVGAALEVPLSRNWSLQTDTRFLTGLTPALRKFSYVELAGFGTDVRSNTLLTRIGVVHRFQKK